MNNIVYFISKNKLSVFLVVSGIIFLISPMSTKEEKPLYVYIVGIFLLVFGGVYLFKNTKKR